MLQANLRIAQMTQSKWAKASAGHGPERKPKSRGAGRRLTGGATLVEAAWKGGPCGWFQCAVLLLFRVLAQRQMLFWLKGTTNMWEIKLKMYRNRVQFAENRRIIYTPRCVIYTPARVILHPKIYTQKCNFLHAKFTRKNV